MSDAIDPLGDSPASKLTKALLSIEWHRNGGGTLTCQGCGSWTFRPTHVRPEQTLDGAGCWVDEALTAAGYPDHDSREAGRRRIDDVERERVDALHEQRRAARDAAQKDQHEFDESG
jgi:hypothetical protein